MEQGSEGPRDVSALVVARVGSVRATSDPVLPWVVVDGAGVPVGPVSEFLRDLLACGSSPASCRSYGYDLLRWFRFLAAVDVVWSRAQRSEVRDFVLWLRTCHNPARDRRRPDAPAPGSVNPRTGKAYLRSGYAPATINHAISVLAEFYDFHVRAGTGPVISPVPPREHRPREEYREPTDGEWAEFRDHFQLRKVALGTCDRPYGTPCQHEHACIRCPMLRLDLAQVPRLLQIETNTHERLDEARRMHWLGEVAALEESLRHIDAKKQQAERLRQQNHHGDAGPTALS